MSSSIPKVHISLTSKTIKCKTRKLKCKSSILFSKSSADVGRSFSKRIMPQPKMSEEAAKELSELRNKIRIPATGDWDSPVKDFYKKAGKKFPEPTCSKDEAIIKWKSLLTGIDSKFHSRAAYIFESEALALKEMSEHERVSVVGKNLKHIFPSIHKELKLLGQTWL